MWRTLSIAILTFGLGFALGHQTNQVEHVVTEVTLRDTIHKRDTIYVTNSTVKYKPVYITVDSKQVDNVLDSSAVAQMDTTIHQVSDSISAKDLDLKWSAKLGILNNQARLFDLMYNYRVICPVITDSVLIREQVTKHHYISSPAKHLSLGGSILMPLNAYSLDVSYHYKWYYVGGQVGSAIIADDRKLFLGLRAGFNINL